MHAGLRMPAHPRGRRIQRGRMRPRPAIRRNSWDGGCTSTGLPRTLLPRGGIPLKRRELGSASASPPIAAAQRAAAAHSSGLREA